MKITICPWCGADVKVKHGKLGFFQGCTDWPRCKFTAKMYYIEGLEMKKMESRSSNSPFDIKKIPLEIRGFSYLS